MENNNVDVTSDLASHEKWMAEAQNMASNFKSSVHALDYGSRTHDAE